MTDPRAAALLALADRVEAGESGREIDRAVYFLIECVPNEGQIHPAVGRAVPVERYPYLMRDDFCPTDGTTCPKYTTSLDATAALQEPVLPGWRLTVVQYPHKMRARLLAPDFGGSCAGDGATLCQAWLAAILRASAVAREESS